MILAAMLPAVALFQGSVNVEAANAKAKGAQAADPRTDGLYNVSLIELGATAKGSGVPINKDWPPNNTLQAGTGRGGTMMGHPLKGGRVDIHLIMPVDIKGLELIALDYGGTLQPKAIDIFVDGQMVKHAELEEKPGQPINIPLDAKGQNVGVLVTDEYPPRTLPDGKKGPNYGGWSRLRVLSTTNVADLMKPVDNYEVPLLPDNIQPTTGSQAAGGKIEVVGQPRETKGHPCTLWDMEDIAHYKEMLKTSKELKAQFEGLQRSMDARLTMPLGIPQPKKGDDGKWMHLSDKADAGNGQTYGAIHNQLGLDIANLGTIYAFTGDAKYAEFCKKLLLAYADAHPNYGIGARAGFNHDPSKVFDQRLSDATWLIPVARGYDLIYNLPSMTPAERKHIEDDLIKANAIHIAGNHAMVEAATNWSSICTCAILTAGYATDDQDLINTAFYGLSKNKEKPNGGLFLKHFGEQAIANDGMWSEGAMGYQFMAMEALIMDAEMLWHHGIDMYRYRDSALKALFDSPLRFSYPDLTAPAIHDSGHGSIVGNESFLYEYAYRRYRDPSYLLILNQVGKHFDAHFQQYPVSILYDRDLQEKVAPVEWKSVNLFSVGYGILRNTTANATNSLLLDYGPAGSHGHPDKLSLDLYAFNAQLMPDPGSIWYEIPLYRQWYHTTVAHNTLVVDELDQIMAGAQQVVYGSAETMGIQRAWTRDAYPGVTMDRSVFFTPDYMADIFGAFARLPRKMDLAWHLIGQWDSGLKMEPMKFPEPAENGYCAMENVRHTSTDKAWSANVTSKENNVARFIAAGGTPTEIIVGDGHYALGHPPTILERRMANATVYGNAIDISGAKDGYVKSVSQEGGLSLGYGLLKVETAKGTDLCFASFRPGNYKAGDLGTDAQQAFVTRDGKDVRSMFLAGGRLMKAAGATLQRSEPGLAFFEKTENGGYVVGNASPGNAIVSVSLTALAGMDAFNVDATGKRIGSAAVSKIGAGVSMQLNGLAKVEFSPKGAVSQLEFRQNMLRKRQAEQEAVLAKAREECIARTKVCEAEAKTSPAPANTVLVAAAPAFTGQGGGEVKVSSNKRASVGDSINQWNSLGHWLEWTFDVPSAGYYNLTACYCSDIDLIQRDILVNGETQEPFAPMIAPSTGGFSNGSDDWRLYTAINPTNNQPLLIKLKQGKNVVRLTNMNDRAMVLNYVAITSPDVKITRDMLAAKIKK